MNGIENQSKGEEETREAGGAKLRVTPRGWIKLEIPLEAFYEIEQLAWENHKQFACEKTSAILVALGKIAPYWRKHSFRYTGEIPCTGPKICYKCGLRAGEQITDLCKGTFVGTRGTD